MNSDDLPAIETELKLVICPSCDGVGGHDSYTGMRVTCPYCRGDGKLMQPVPVEKKVREYPPR